MIIVLGDAISIMRIKNREGYQETIKFLKADLDKMVNDGTLESVLKLSETRNCSYTNMHLYGADGRIKKYNNVNEFCLRYTITALAF